MQCVAIMVPSMAQLVADKGSWGAMGAELVGVRSRCLGQLTCVTK